MKNTKLQIILISILTLGMISLLISLNVTTSKNNNLDFLPTTIEDNELLTKSVELDNYQQIKIEKHEFPIFDSIKSGQVYFDPTLSYQDIDIDTLNFNIGDIVRKDEIIGKLNGTDIQLDFNCLITNFDNNKATLKKLDTVYIKFSFNIYDSYQYSINDRYAIFKNGEQLAEGKIIKIDYLNIQDDYTTSIIEVDNSNLTFLNNTSVSFTNINYELKESYATNATLLNISDRSYRVMDVFKDLICIKDKQIYNVSVKLGICFGDYVEIKEALSEFRLFDISSGDFYVRSSNN